MRKVLFILGQLSDADVDWLAETGQREKIPRGHNLVVEGQPLTALYFILDGTFDVHAKGAGHLASLGCGEIVGEMSLIDARPPAASVQAQSDAVVLTISKATLTRKLATDVAFAANFYRAVAIFLSDRMRSTVQRMGYGKAGALAQDNALEGELDACVLDNIHLAGARFETILKKFLG